MNAPEERVRDMPSVKLAYGHEVDGGYIKPCPAGKSHGMEKYPASAGDAAEGQVGKQPEYQRGAEVKGFPRGADADMGEFKPQCRYDDGGESPYHRRDGRPGDEKGQRGQHTVAP